MGLYALGVDRRLQYEVIETLYAEECAGYDQNRMTCGESVYGAYDAYADRYYASDKGPGVRYDVHHAHDEPYEQGVVGLHAEEYHCRRYDYHQDDALGKYSGEVSRQKICYRVECACDILLQPFGEHGLDHGVEQAVLLEKEEGYERY